jgi:hypothetical protein
MDRGARQRWLINTLKQLEQCQPTVTPRTNFNQDEVMEEQLTKQSNKGCIQHNNNSSPPKR